MSNPHDLRSPQVTFLQKRVVGVTEGRGAPGATGPRPI